MGRRRKKEEIPPPDCSLCHHFAKAVGRSDGGRVRLCSAVNRYVCKEDSPPQCDHYQLYRWVYCGKKNQRVSIFICAKNCTERCSMQKVAQTYQYGPPSETLPKPEMPSSSKPIFMRRRAALATPTPVSTPTVIQPRRKPILVSNRKRKPIPVGGSNVQT